MFFRSTGALGPRVQGPPSSATKRGGVKNFCRKKFFFQKTKGPFVQTTLVSGQGPTEGPWTLVLRRNPSLGRRGGGIPPRVVGDPPVQGGQVRPDGTVVARLW